jgi:hypothetical protein
MKCFLFIAVFSLILFGCSKSNVIKIDLENLQEINQFSAFVESFYYYNKRLPKSFEELTNWISEDEKAYFDNFIDSINKKIKITYIPLKSDKESNDFDSYVLVGIVDETLNTKMLQFEKDLTDLVSVCELKKGINKNVILYYDSVYLFNYKSKSFSVEICKTDYWKDRINYYVEFEVDSNLNIDENLKFEIDVYDRHIEGKLLNNNIKNLLKNSKFPIMLKGLKDKNNDKSFFLNNVIIVPNEPDYYLSESFVDEIGEIKIPYHLKGCR